MARESTTPSRPPDRIAVVRDPGQARSLLDPFRRAILDRLQEPGSASSVARELGLPRQRVNYHVRGLEQEGLLLHVEDRRKGNCVERLLRASARQYLIAPGAAGEIEGESASPGGARDPFSSSELLVAAARSLTEVGELEGRAREAGRRLPTLSLEARIRFRTPREEVEFAQAMHEVLARMSERYHDPHTVHGRTFRVTIGGHPIASSEGRAPVGGATQEERT